MNTQVEHLDNHTARLTVDVTPERVEKAMQAAARKISQQVQIPGFRKGKAPYNIVLQRFGREAVLGEAVETLGNDVYKEALEEAKIEPYAPGNLEDMVTEPTLRMIFVVPKRPEVELGSYRDVRVDYETPEINDEQVNKAMQSLVERRALVETVERPAQLGDQVKIKVNATVTHPASEDKTEGEEAHPHTDNWMQDEELTPVLTADEKEEEVMPGFSKELVGASAGDTKEFTIAFPEDYKDEGETHFAGHTYNFTVEVQEVKSRTLPAMNDDFAKTVTNGEIDTLLGLRMDIRKQLQDMAVRDADSEYGNKVLDQIVAGSTIKYPEEMVDEHIHEVLESLDQNLRQRGLSLDAYKQLEKKTDEQLHEEYREPAIKRLQRSLVLGEMVKQEQLDVTPEALDRQIEQMSQQFGEQASIFKSMLMQGQYRENIFNDMLTQRAMKRLVSIGKGENPAIGPDPEPEVPEADPVSAAPVETAESTDESTPAESASSPEVASEASAEPAADKTNNE